MRLGRHARVQVVVEEAQLAAVARRIPAPRVQVEHRGDGAVRRGTRRVGVPLCAGQGGSAPGCRRSGSVQH